MKARVCKIVCVSPPQGATSPEAIVAGAGRRPCYDGRGMARGRLETTVTRRKKGDPAAERVAAAIMEEFSPKTAEEAQEALRSVFGPMIETMLKAELEAHLGYPDNDKGPKDGPNRRNGYTRKVVRTSAGEVPIDVPRDRDATFEPAVVPKGERC